ncbi:MAG: radical SAM protein, partial [Planctomycetota bacterium]
MTGQYRLATLGCKVNQYESQRLREVLESFGLRPAQDGSGGWDLALVNTCAVTAEACRKSRRVVRRLSRNGTVPVIVVGCGAAAEADRWRRLDAVTAVYGHDADVCAELRKFLSVWTSEPPSGEAPNRSPSGSERPDRENKGWMRPGPSGLPARSGGSSTASSDPILTLPLVKKESQKELHLVERIESFAGHQRAFLKIQDGCDAHCTYCIIPRLRPRVRFKPIAAVVDEARRLVAAGHREIILTGIFLGAYGRTTALRKRWGRRSGRSPLARLVEALCDVDGLERLRLSSLEPGDVDASLLDVLATRKPCVPHLHLPLQSGSERILRRMNRQYTRDDFLRMIDRVRAALDRPAITTDIIVGFPGETDADFE